MTCAIPIIFDLTIRHDTDADEEEQLPPKFQGLVVAACYNPVGQNIDAHNFSFVSSKSRQ
jgi:hypothetical protein